ncbi:MAG TPA: hypothetical protein VFS21_02975 [Roseiflexaceae bacterium]|nr:hypothetical protein [Roseiflexaceae bacterium]
MRWVVFSIAMLLIVGVVLLSRRWSRGRTLSPEWRSRLQNGFLVALALMTMDFAALRLFLATEPAPGDPLTMLVLGSLVAMLLPISLLVFPFTVAVASGLMDGPAHPPPGRPVQLSLASTVIFVCGLSIAIMGVVPSPSENQPSYRIDGSYGMFFIGLCFALFGLAQLCRPVYAPATRFIC